jgi:hypothetical protein
MNRNILLWRAIFFLLIVISPLDSAAQDDRRDGNWWQAQHPSSKIAYMTGFFDGMDLGHHFSYWKYANVKSKQDVLPDVAESYYEHTEKFFKNVTNGQLADGVDNFYSDYRNRRIRVNDAVWLVVNEIAGTPRRQLDTMIENWRRSSGSR